MDGSRESRLIEAHCNDDEGRKTTPEMGIIPWGIRRLSLSLSHIISRKGVQFQPKFQQPSDSSLIDAVTIGYTTTQLELGGRRGNMK